jgi:hypothetical protein
MRSPKKRIKMRLVIYKIISDLMQGARELDIKHPEAVAVVAADKIADLISNNYRRRKK